jgi:GTP pyrophosphokinase
MEDHLTAFKDRVASFSPRDQDRIGAALSLGKGEGLRQSIGIASVLLDINPDGDTVTAALLLGFQGIPIKEQFGPTIAGLVAGVLRTGDISAKNKTIREAKNIRKMLFAMADDIRIIFIKLAERLYTMRTPEDLPPPRKKTVAQECLDVYAPLADRLGISWIKDELEDLALKQLNREAYNQIKKIVSEKREERHEFLNTIQADIQREAAASGIPIKVSSRAKHFYSIYQKMRRRNKAAQDLYDLFGIRIICENIEQCYTVLGLVHRLWKPLDGRFKDYIAMPKSNGYQSLHTTVIAGMAKPPVSRIPEEIPGSQFPDDSEAPLQISEGRMLEIQIRTREMHHIAEYGVASHWLYKKGSSRNLVRPVDISIVNRLRDWKHSEAAGKPGKSGGGPAGNESGRPAAEKSDGQNVQDSKSFLEDIKREILKDSIYVFTPMGKVVELPAGSTPLDFAYHIHSAIGEHCVGAKADGSIVPLSSELRNTQVVEILTSPQAHPHINWLRIVKTSRARGKIRAWLEQNDDSIIIEKNVVAKKKPAPEPEKPAELPPENPALQQVIRQGDQALQVRVEDEKNLMIRFARCCRPVTGDPIVGYISRGRGIIIHRKNCSNLAGISDFEERKIDVEWENAADVLIRHFRIEAKTQANLFSEIEGALHKNRGHLIEGRLEETTTNRLTGFFTVQLETAGNLKHLTRHIRGIPGVYSVQTINGS